MTRRKLFAVLLVAYLTFHFDAYLPTSLSFAQVPEEQPPPVASEPPPAAAETPPASVETPPVPVEPPASPAEPPPVPAPQQDEQAAPEPTPQEREDVFTLLNELRGRVGTSPENTEDRLKLAETLYRIGDLDASIDECRAALNLDPDSAKAHLQLGVAFMARQDWRASLTELKEAVRLDPELTQAHYNLGTVYYTTGNLKAAIQSYQQALELQSSFPMARYRLALVLKLAHRDQESVQFMEEAAAGGVPQAQYFLGNAYRAGQGVEKRLALAVTWWVRAAEHGLKKAVDSLVQIRLTSLKGSRNKDAQAAAQALRDYRNSLWQEFPDLSRADETESVGRALIKAGRAEEAVPLLIREAYASPVTARPLLETLYEHGVENQLPPFDARILRFFKTTAAAGLPDSRMMLAQIYARGLGVPQDPQKARALLKGFSKGPGSQTKKD